MRDDLAGVYLETATEANVAYYTHVGYQVIGETHVRSASAYGACSNPAPPNR